MVGVTIRREKFDTRACGVALIFDSGCVALAIDLGKMRLWIEFWKR